MASKSDAGVVMTVTLVSAVASAWKKIRELNPDVPKVILTVGSGTLGARKGIVHLGHFAANRWQHTDDTKYPELFVGGEGLRQGAEELLSTLLHEAAHGVAHVRKVQDTSRQGRYHNDAYAKLAGEIGLEVNKDAKNGWNQTRVTDDIRADYAKEIALLGKALTAYRYNELEARNGGEKGDGEKGEGDGEEKKNSNNLKCVCGCEKPRIIRVSRSVLELGAIECRECGKDFAPAE
ncbi:MAG TPA: hypothetical protein VLT90_12955 [Terriglobales bacterium]|nr:hypothetical protein [Terriglobales bacterium]